MFRLFGSMILGVVMIGLSSAQGPTKCGPQGCKLRTAIKTAVSDRVVPNSSVGASSFNVSDFNLAPGEVLVSVDDVMVNQSSAQPTVGPVRRVVANAMSHLVVDRDQRAYQHALREAQIIAARGEGYHRSSDGGHPLGVAPGCSFSGTGFSRDPNRPNHCYLGELPDSRLIARAMVPGPNGTYFWSAHYR